MGFGHAPVGHSGMTVALRRQASAPAEADAADRQRDGGLGRFDDRDLDGFIEVGAAARHAGAPRD